MGADLFHVVGNEAYSPFSQFCERAQKPNTRDRLPSAPHTRPTQQLSRPPPIQKLGAENHMLQLNI